MRKNHLASDAWREACSAILMPSASNDDRDEDVENKIQYVSDPGMLQTKYENKIDDRMSCLSLHYNDHQHDSFDNS